MGQGCCRLWEVLWGLQVQQLNQSLHPQPRQSGWPRGLPGDGGDLGGVLKTLSCPVVKAPAISLPCHWRGHSMAWQASPQPHRVCTCIQQPSPLPGCWVRGPTKEGK